MVPKKYGWSKGYPVGPGVLGEGRTGVGGAVVIQGWPICSWRHQGGVALVGVELDGLDMWSPPPEGDHESMRSTHAPPRGAPNTEQIPEESSIEGLLAEEEDSGIGQGHREGAARDQGSTERTSVESLHVRGFL